MSIDEMDRHLSQREWSRLKGNEMEGHVRTCPPQSGHLLFPGGFWVNHPVED